MQDYLEIAGVAVGILYIWFEYRASVWLWLTGIVMPAIYIFVYYDSGFYADMGINVYFLVAGLYGWAVWAGLFRRKKREKENKQLPISRTPLKSYLPLALSVLVSFGVIAWILYRYTNSSVVIGDSITTALSIVGLWMLAQKYVEQWLVWIVVDIVSAGLYLWKGLYPTGALYLAYTVIAVFGYFKWIRMMKRQQTLQNE